MKTTCPTCHARYEIPDARAAGKVLKIRCKRCAGVMDVIGPTADFRPGVDVRPPTLTNARAYVSTLPHAALEEGERARWWCGIGGRPHGPYQPREIKALVERGDVHGRTYMWTRGMPGWERVAESPSLAFAYTWVVERAGEHAAAVGASSSAITDMAALVSDGGAYFPDPTLKSGWLVLDERTQAYLETCARRGQLRAAGARRGLAAAPLFALGILTAISGSAWLLSMGPLSSL